MSSEKSNQSSSDSTWEKILNLLEQRNESQEKIISFQHEIMEIIIKRLNDGIHHNIQDMKDKKSHTELVKEFTEQSLGITLPTKPSKMSKEEVRFIVRMVLSEMLELCATITPNVESAFEFFKECYWSVDRPKEFNPDSKSDTEIMAEQYDSFVDAWYYMLNTAVKKGVNLDFIFRVVHEANMAKRFPDGTFHRRPEDGKIIKPEGWKEPDIVGEIKKQLDF